MAKDLQAELDSLLVAASDERHRRGLKPFTEEQWDLVAQAFALALTHERVLHLVRAGSMVPNIHNGAVTWLGTGTASHAAVVFSQALGKDARA